MAIKYKQDGDIRRELTEDEYAQSAADEANYLADVKATAAAEKAAIIAKAALLARLGITADEATLLLS
jgi:hypothetical protein